MLVLSPSLELSTEDVLFIGVAHGGGVVIEGSLTTEGEGSLTTEGNDLSMLSIAGDS